MIDEIFRARANFYAFLSRMYVEEPPFELAEDIANGKIQLPQTTSFDSDFSEGLFLFENSQRVMMMQQKFIKAQPGIYSSFYRPCACHVTL